MREKLNVDLISDVARTRPLVTMRYTNYAHLQQEPPRKRRARQMTDGEKITFMITRGHWPSDAEMVIWEWR